MSPTPLAIVASSGWASEIVGIVDNPAPGSEQYRVSEIVGSGELLTDIASRLGVPLRAGLDELGAAHVVFAVGHKPTHRDLVATASRLGLSAVTLVHRDTTRGPWVTLGSGVVVAPGVRITGNVIVGDHSSIHTAAVLSHDDVLGEFVTISPSATLCGGVTVGSGAAVFAGATVMPGVTIGENATVGAGSLVNRDVAAGTTVAGVPAKVLG